MTAAHTAQQRLSLEMCSVRFRNSQRPYMDAPNLCQAFLRVTRPTGFDCTRTSGLCCGAKAAVPDGFCWLTPNRFLALVGARTLTGFISHGLTCLAITRTTMPA